VRSGPWADRSTKILNCGKVTSSRAATMERATTANNAREASTASTDKASLTPLKASWAADGSAVAGPRSGLTCFTTAAYKDAGATVRTLLWYTRFEG